MILPHAVSFLVSARGLAFIGVLALWTMGTQTSQAAQINWGNLPFTDNRTRQDVPINSSFVFELGVFEEGFIPTGENVDQWADHWRAADRVAYDPQTAFASGSYVEVSNPPPFEKGRRGYIWGYQNEDDPRAEWILVTDSDWQWPEANPLAFPVTWLMTASSTTVAGQVDAEGNFTTARIEGARRPRLSGMQWQSLVFTPAELQDARITGWQGDPDGDGLSNLVEMAFATNPKTVDPSLPRPFVMVRRVEENGKTFLEMHVAKRADRDVKYVVEVSSDQRIWAPAVTGGTLRRNSLHELIVRDGIPLEGLSARFIRLTVALP